MLFHQQAVLSLAAAAAAQAVGVNTPACHLGTGNFHHHAWCDVESSLCPLFVTLLSPGKMMHSN
jgi:hypothetical protein